MREVFSAEQSVNKDGAKQLTVVFAERAQLQVSDDLQARYLVLNNGYQSVGQPGGLSYRISHFDEFGQLVNDPTGQRSTYRKSDARTTRQLFHSAELVILVPIIALIAQALSKTNHRRGRYVKMLPAFLIYIVYLVALNAARDAIGKGTIPLTMGMWWIHLVFLSLGVVLLFGGDWARRVRASMRTHVVTPLQ